MWKITNTRFYSYNRPGVTPVSHGVFYTAWHHDACLWALVVESSGCGCGVCLMGLLWLYELHAHAFSHLNSQVLVPWPISGSAEPPHTPLTPATPPRNEAIRSLSPHCSDSCVLPLLGSLTMSKAQACRECLAGSCTGDMCRKLYFESRQCVRDGQCMSGFCKDGICKRPAMISC